MPRTALQLRGVPDTDFAKSYASSPSFAFQRHAICHGAEPLVHVLPPRKGDRAALVVADVALI